MLLRLQGGLGNQLFQLIALRYAARKHQSSPIIFPGHLHKFATARAFEIQPFLKDEAILQDLSWFDAFLFDTKASRFLSKFGVHAIESVTQLNHWNGQVLNGYFQDIYQYEDVSLLKAEIDVLRKVVQQQFNALDFQIHPNDCGVHLRLTDFVATKAQENFLLQYRLPYIKNAIAWFKEHHGINRFVLFTDAPDQAMDLLKDAEIALFADISTKKINLFEEFCIFCAFPKMIASNSTFSFWGSVLGGNKEVVFPKIWDTLKSQDEKVFQENLRMYHNFITDNQMITRL